MKKRSSMIVFSVLSLILIVGSFATLFLYSFVVGNKDFGKAFAELGNIFGFYISNGFVFGNFMKDIRVTVNLIEIGVAVILAIVWLIIDAKRRIGTVALYIIMTLATAFLVGVFMVDFYEETCRVIDVIINKKEGAVILPNFYIIACGIVAITIADVFLLVMFIIDMATGGKLAAYRRELEDSSEDYLEKEKLASEPKKAPEKPVSAEAPAAPAAAAAPTKEPTKVYHVSKRAEDGLWVIKYIGGSKVIKTFRTKAEAVEYAESLSEKQNGIALTQASKGKHAGKVNEIIQ